MSGIDDLNAAVTQMQGAATAGNAQLSEMVTALQSASSQIADLQTQVTSDAPRVEAAAKAHWNVHHCTPWDDEWLDRPGPGGNPSAKDLAREEMRVALAAADKAVPMVPKAEAERLAQIALESDMDREAAVRELTEALRWMGGQKREQ